MYSKKKFLLLASVTILAGCGGVPQKTSSNVDNGIVKYDAAVPEKTKQPASSDSSVAAPTKSAEDAENYETADSGEHFLQLGDKENETANIEEMRDNIIPLEEKAVFQNIEYQVTDCRFSKLLSVEHPELLFDWAEKNLAQYGGFVAHVDLHMKNVGTKTKEFILPTYIVSLAGRPGDLKEIIKVSDCVYNDPIQSEDEKSAFFYTLAPEEEYSVQIAYIMDPHSFGYHYYLALVDGTMDRALLRGDERFIDLGEVSDESALAE